MTDTLLPCPFCGRLPYAGVTDYSDHQFVAICKECPISPSTFSYSIKDVINTWNTRAPHPAEKALRELVCLLDKVYEKPSFIGTTIATRKAYSSSYENAMKKAKEVLKDDK